MYNRAIDIDGLRRFHHHLQRGRLSRRIERSPLPFGRHRWVSPSGQSDLEIVATPRPREEFDAWLSEQANTPLDAEHGPEWHLAVLPFTDGGAGVSLVISHCLTDAVGLCEALADAASGRHDPISWPAAGSRRRWQALREDARQTARDIPGIGGAVVAAARLARRNRGRAGSDTAPLNAVPPAPRAGADERITLPTATIFLDADEWDARAHSLGGTSNTLLAGLAARLAQRVGRVTADGSVTLGMPVNLRTAGDTRANAVTNVDITVDPAPAATDLREMRAAIKASADPLSGACPTNGWRCCPSFLCCRSGWSSEWSAWPPAVRPASSHPTSAWSTRPSTGQTEQTPTTSSIKGSNSGVTKAIMHRTGGIMALLSGRSDRQVFVSVLSYQPGRTNSNDNSAKRPFERSERLLAHRHDRLAMP